MFQVLKEYKKIAWKYADTGVEAGVIGATAVISAMWAVKTLQDLRTNPQEAHLYFAGTVHCVVSYPGVNAILSTT